MEWLAENATNIYFGLGFATFMLAGVWWIQKQLIYLAFAGISLVLLLGAWLWLRTVPTTANRIEADLVSLSRSLLAKESEPEKYVVEEFKYSAKTPAKWKAYLLSSIDEHNVDAINVKNFELKSHKDGEAKVLFKLEVRSKGKTVFSADCPWTLRRENEVWKVEKVTLRNKSADGD